MRSGSKRRLSYSLSLTALSSFSFAQAVHAQVPQTSVGGELSTSASEPADWQTHQPEGGKAPSHDTGAEGDYLHRYQPVAGLAELGAFIGPLFLSDLHSFRGPPTLNSGANPTPRALPNFKQPAVELGIRGAYFPFSFLGAELEGMVAAAETDKGDGVTVLAARGHVMLQSPFWSVVPFVLGGVGYWEVLNDVSGNDTDPAFHFGGGAKVNVSSHLALRLDVRDTVTNQRAVGGYPNHVEALLGGTLVLGRSTPAPRKDTDGDSWTDERDQCPLEAGTLPQGCPIRDTDADGILDPEDHCVHQPGLAPTGCPPADADQDGVTDNIDQCVNEKGSAPSGCPDADQDAVFDKNDKCPAVAGVAPDGCPLDADGDGILGADDHCPDVAETKNLFEDTDGCPDELPQAIKNFMGVIKGIEFDTDKDVIRPGSQSVLDQAFSVLEKYPSLRVEIIGYTDDRGALEHNLDLSHRRAAAVKSHLVGQGIAPDRIQSRGAGPEQPLESNSTLPGRQKNRRIEFKIIE
jgi:outer membrane protein OmpA-like peptidoglycan-associated protein